MFNITKIGIVGAGTMGAALAQKFSREGFPVVLVDREKSFLDRGLAAIRETLTEGIDRKLFTPDQAEAILARITPVTDYDALRDCQLVVEAVFEDLQVKHSVFRKLSEVVPATAIIATNTSSFSVTECAAAVSHPQRFIGLHFFYHAAKNRLVEIVRGRDTSDDTFQTMLLFMQRCGKDPIVCRDAPGFVVNRFFVPWLNEAVRILETGRAETGTIDAVCRKTFGCGMGPFALMNATGVPIAFHAQKTLAEAYGAFYEPAAMLRHQVTQNQPWEISETDTVDPALFTWISERMLGEVFFVCGQLLDEQVCSAGDINRGARIGLRWRKGPLDLFHRYGPDKVRQLVRNFVSDRIPHSLTKNAWRPDYIATDRHGSTTTITLNRPEDLNALNPTVARQLNAAFETANRSEATETIIITGRGKAFMAGADIKFFVDHIKNGTIPEILAFTKYAQELLQRIDDSSKTIVAVINGLALGGGLELALAADRIVAFEKAILAFPETGIGIYPGLGGTQRTVKRIGPGLTKYLIYTGNFISAREALDIGLVDHPIDWESFEALCAGRIPPKPERHELPEKWRLIADRGLF
ncbi:MAG: 3-hydroxyacyl-CoA dehydrogenase/enoyl-CoA hydratase family protein [FCB group bacterium]|nr:3-hydroxyacyl-CoA dehydrogenase/enoyl-CoA hydratase family protein [FCB group bacterium]